MPQTLWAEDWPDDDRPGTVAYFCGSLDAPWPTTDDHADYMHRYREQVHAEAADFLDRNLGLYLPECGHRAGLRLASAQRRQTANAVAAALATQHVSVNIDPSDRYVQSVPGS